MFYVVSYDISDDKKRNKVAKILFDFGKRVQYSVFECILEDKHLKKMVSRLKKAVSQEDSVRIYPLCMKCKSSATVMGGGDITKDESVYIL